MGYMRKESHEIQKTKYRTSYARLIMHRFMPPDYSTIRLDYLTSLKITAFTILKTKKRHNLDKAISLEHSFFNADISSLIYITRLRQNENWKRMLYELIESNLTSYK